MGKISEFFFGKDQSTVGDRGEIIHDLHAHTWRSWDERYAAKENDWRHHQGNYPLSHDLNFSVVDPGRDHVAGDPDWRRSSADHRADPEAAERAQGEAIEAEWRPATPTRQDNEGWLRNFLRRRERFQPV